MINQQSLLRLTFLQVGCLSSIVVVLLTPALIWYLYSPAPFIYFNLIGASLFLMTGLTRLEFRFLGFNPFSTEGVVLSPEVRQITLRVVSWFKRHKNVPLGAILFLFLLFVGIDLELEPVINQITSPFVGFFLAIGAVTISYFPVALLGIVYHSAVWPRSSSVSELVGLVDKVGEDEELVPPVIEAISRRKVGTPQNIPKKVSLGMLVACVAVLELMGSGVLSLREELIIAVPIGVAMAIYLIILFVSDLLSRRRSVLEAMMERS